MYTGDTVMEDTAFLGPTAPTLVPREKLTVRAIANPLELSAKQAELIVAAIRPDSDLDQDGEMRLIQFVQQAGARIEEVEEGDRHYRLLRRAHESALLRLIEQFSPLVRIEVSTGVDSDKHRRLVAHSAAKVGLIGAIGRYDPERGLNHRAFLRQRIRWAIKDELRGESIFSKRSTSEARIYSANDEGTRGLEQVVEVNSTEGLDDKLTLMFREMIKATFDVSKKLQLLDIGAGRLPGLGKKLERDILIYKWASGLQACMTDEELGLVRLLDAETEAKSQRSIANKLNLDETTVSKIIARQRHYFSRAISEYPKLIPHLQLARRLIN